MFLAAFISRRSGDTGMTSFGLLPYLLAPNCNFDKTGGTSVRLLFIV